MRQKTAPQAEPAEDQTDFRSPPPLLFPGGWPRPETISAPSQHLRSGDLAWQKSLEQEQQEPGTDILPGDTRTTTPAAHEVGKRRPQRKRTRSLMIYIDDETGAALDRGVANSGLSQREFVEMAIKATALADSPAARAQLVNDLTERYRKNLSVAFSKS